MAPIIVIFPFSIFNLILTGLSGTMYQKGGMLPPRKEEFSLKVLLINGSPHRDGCTATALKEVGKALEDLGIQSEMFWVGSKPVPSCVACGSCQGGVGCVYDDGVNRILERCEEFDGLVVGSPVYYGCASGQIISFLDRLFHASGGRLAGKAAAAVVSCRRGGASTAFQQLNMFFGMNNLIVATSQYWNQVHGNTPQEVEQDLEGLQTMRTLAQNLAWILKGRAAGTPMPTYEPKIATNFIR